MNKNFDLYFHKKNVKNNFENIFNMRLKLRIKCQKNNV